MLGRDVVVHVGVQLAGEEALMAVEELRSLLVEDELAQASSIHVITELRMDGAHVDLHILIIRASEAAVPTLQAYGWFPQFLTHFHLVTHHTTGQRFKDFNPAVAEKEIISKDSVLNTILYFHSCESRMSPRLQGKGRLPCGGAAAL